jgi:hypothetical protein
MATFLKRSIPIRAMPSAKAARAILLNNELLLAPAQHCYTTGEGYVPGQGLAVRDALRTARELRPSSLLPPVALRHGLTLPRSLFDSLRTTAPSTRKRRFVDYCLP